MSTSTAWGALHSCVCNAINLQDPPCGKIATLLEIWRQCDLMTPIQDWEQMFSHIHLILDWEIDLPPPLKAGKSWTSSLGPTTAWGRAGRALNMGSCVVGTMPNSACASAWISPIFFAWKHQLRPQPSVSHKLTTARAQIQSASISCSYIPNFKQLFKT